MSRLPKLLTAAGCLCLVVVVLTHVAEHWRILPGMGWGLPTSPGHYLDLSSATGGIALLLAALITRIRRANHPAKTANFFAKWGIKIPSENLIRLNSKAPPC